MLDPLNDDQVKLAYRMHLNKVDVKINLFRHLEHGILTIYPKDFLPGKIFQEMVQKEVELAVKMPISETASQVADNLPSTTQNYVPDLAD